MAAMRTCSRLLLLAAVATIFFAADTAGTNPGEWIPVKLVDSPFIQEMGRWTVAQMHTVLSFDKVETARYQALDDTGYERNYELIIDASQRAGAGDDKYRAVVHVIHGLGFVSVLSFEAVRACIGCS
ncbi:hypothetical protein ACP70R_020576 [Stipagrostis hirtigluma subsp. patula]